MSVLSKPLSICDGLTRREALRVGGLASMGLSLPTLLRATERGSIPKARSCIVLFLMGGPPQHSTWDPKPEAIGQVRGDFGVIDTAVPGMRIGELLPRTATLAEHLCLLRAVRTGDQAHSSSGYYMMTGVPHQPMNRENVNPGAPNNWPNYASIIRRFTPSMSALPSTVRLPHHIWNTDGSIWPGQEAGFLGRVHDPWLFRGDPSASNFRVSELSLPTELTLDRVSDRRGLLRDLETVATRHEKGMLSVDYDHASGQAFDLLTSEKSRRAFALEEELASVRDRYGRTPFGQSVLLARRLIEAGVRLVHVNWYRSADEPSDAPCWDSHARESDRLKSLLVPPFDLAFSALLEDLRSRGLLEETLVACVSEFGRSPKMNPQGGRDHWGNVFSVALAGGGIKGGTIHGASDSVGGEPIDGLVRPEDLLATIYHLLGINPESEYRDQLDRPVAASKGEVIRSILS